MDELDREVAQLEELERNRRAAWARIRTAIEAGTLAGIYAGSWLSIDQEWLVVAVTEHLEEAEAELHRAVPDAPVRVVSRPHSLASLEALLARIEVAGDRLGVPWAYTGLKSPENVVEIALEDLDHPASRELRAQFASAPVYWLEDKVIAGPAIGPISAADRPDE